MPQSPLSGKIVSRRGAAKRAGVAIMQEARDLGSDSEPAGELSEPGPSRVSKRGNGKARSGTGDGGGFIGQGTGDLERRRSSPIKTYSVKRKRRAAALADSDSDSIDGIPSSSSRTINASSPITPKPTMKGRKKEKPPPPPPVALPSLVVNLDDDDSDLTPLTSPVEPSEGPTADAPSSSTHQTHATREHPMFITRSPAKDSLLTKARSRSSWEVKEVEWNLEDVGELVWVHLDSKNSKNANVCTTRWKGKETLWWPAAILHKPKTPLKVKLFGKHSRTVNIEKPCADNVLSRLNNYSLRFDSYESALQGGASRDYSAVGSQRKRQKTDDEFKSAWESATHEMLDRAQEDSLEADELPHPMEALNMMTSLHRTGSLSTLRLDGQIGGSGVGRKGKRKRGEPDWATDEEISQGLPLEDANLELPGEPVLSRGSKPHEKVYWPAKLLRYVPPKRKGQKGTYKISFLDMSQDEVPRTHFHTMTDPGFATVKIGEFQSAVVDDTNDHDEDDDDDEELGRSPSPPCRNPPPPQAKFITLSLREQFVYVKPILQAILHNEYGPTKDKVHTFMTGSVKERNYLTQASTDRGMMDPRQVKELVHYVKLWCLRDGRKPKHVDVSTLDHENGVTTEHPEDSELSATLTPSSPAPTELAYASPPPTEPPGSSFSPLTEVSSIQDESLADVGEAEKLPMDLEPAKDATLPGENVDNVTRGPPQTGSPDYEALSSLDKLHFCADILLLEAIRQVLLWRAGTRTSTQLLSDEEERGLFDEGQKLLTERDWVDDIKRWRARMEKQIAGDAKNSGGDGSRFGRRSKPVNYAE